MQTLHRTVDPSQGENAGAGGQMSNVLRVFNDDVVRTAAMHTRTCCHPFNSLAVFFAGLRVDAAHREEPIGASPARIATAWSAG